MTDQISWHVELTVKPGQIGNFRALTTQMVESTRHEAGVVNYERFVRAMDARELYLMLVA